MSSELERVGSEYGESADIGRNTRYMDLLESGVAEEQFIPDSVVVSERIIDQYVSEIDDYIDVNKYGAINIHDELLEFYHKERSEQVRGYSADFNLEHSLNYNFGGAIGNVITSETKDKEVEPNIEAAVENLFEDEPYDYLRDPTMMIMKKGAYVSKEFIEQKNFNRYRLQD